MAPDTADLSVLFSVSREKHRHNYSEVKHHSELNLRCSLGLRWQTNTLRHLFPQSSEFWVTTYPGYTTRPSLHWAFGPQWCSVPGSRPTPSSDAASLATWCHRPRPKPAAWSDLMSCGTRCADREQVGGLLFWHMWQHAAEAYASPEQINICLKWFKNHMLYHSAASSSWLINLKEKKCFRLGYIY